MNTFLINGVYYKANTYKEAQDQAKAAQPKPVGPQPVQPVVQAVSFTITVVPEDNFPGRSQTQFAIGEKLTLGFTTQPQRTAASFGGLQWRIKSGPGTLTTPVPTDGTAVLTMKDTAGTVVLELCTVIAPVVVKATKTLWVLEPSGASIVQANNRTYHQNNTASAGFTGKIRLTPTNISFYRCEMREGSAKIKATGSLGVQIASNATASNSGGQALAVQQELNNLQGARHPVMGDWMGFGNGSINTGSEGVGTDTIRSVTLNPPYSAGTFDWEIPWFIRVIGSNTEKQFFTATHSEVVTATGQMTISKAGFSLTKQASDASSAL